MFSPHWSQPAGNITSSWVLGRCSKKPPAAICCDQSREIAEMVGSTARGPRPALARTLLISPSTYASSSAGVCVGTAVGSGVGSTKGSTVGVGSGIGVSLDSGMVVGSGATVAGMSTGVGSAADEAPAATATTKVGAGLGVGSGIAVGAAVGSGAAVGCGVEVGARGVAVVGTSRGAVVGTELASGAGSIPLGRRSIDCVAIEETDWSVPDRAEFARNTMTMVAAIVAATFSARYMAGLARVEEVMAKKELLEDSVAEL